MDAKCFSKGVNITIVRDSQPPHHGRSGQTFHNLRICACETPQCRNDFVQSSLFQTLLLGTTLESYARHDFHPPRETSSSTLAKSILSLSLKNSPVEWIFIVRLQIEASIDVGLAIPVLILRIISDHSDALHMMKILCCDTAGIVPELEREDKDVLGPEGGV